MCCLYNLINRRWFSHLWCCKWPDSDKLRDGRNIIEISPCSPLLRNHLPLGPPLSPSPLIGLLFLLRLLLSFLGINRTLGGCEPTQSPLSRNKRRALICDSTLRDGGVENRKFLQCYDALRQKENLLLYSYLGHIFPGLASHKKSSHYNSI